LDTTVEEEDVAAAEVAEAAEAEWAEEDTGIEEGDVAGAEAAEAEWTGEDAGIEEGDVAGAEAAEAEWTGEDAGIEEEDVAEVEVAEAEWQEEGPEGTIEVDTEEEASETAAQDVGGRIEGTVKWFSNPKGYGFISREGGEDVFVHYSEIQGSGFRSLSAGDRVEFTLKQSEKGPRAAEVRSLETTIGSGWL
jgi:CspA family cold shock protein